MNNPLAGKLITRADELVAGQRAANADFIQALIDIEAAGEHLRYGYTSLFTLCVERWRFVEPAAARRSRAVRAAKKHPQILALLRLGELSLEAIHMLEPILSEGNANRLLEAARGKRIREVEALIATEAPRPDTPDLIRLSTLHAMPLPMPAPAAASGDACPATIEVQAYRPPAMRERAVQLSERRIHFSFTGPVELRTKLERLRAYLRHKFPEGRLEQLIGEAVDFRLSKVDPDLWPDGRSSAKLVSPSRRIPRTVKRAVWRRDEGSCSYVGADGKRCGTNSWLEYDHIVPAAIGGPSTAENLRLLCRAHNQWRGRRLEPGSA